MGEAARSDPLQRSEGDADAPQTHAAALLAVLEALNAASTRSEIAHAAVRSIQAASRARWVAILDEQADGLAVAASAVLDTDAQRELAHALAQTRSSEAEVLLTGVALLSEAEGRVILPLRMAGRSYGVLSLRVGAGELTGEARQLFTRIATCCAQALARCAEDGAETRRPATTTEEFLTIAAHELRTPVSALQLQIRSAETRLSQGKVADAADRLCRAERSTRRLALLVTRLLDRSRIETGQLEIMREEMDLAGLVRDAVGRLEDELAYHGCPLIVGGPEVIRGLWDPGRIEQIVSNLIVNAGKFGRGTPIHVVTGCDGGTAHVAVSDGGIGVDPSDHERIFQPFGRAVTGHRRGLGIGLWISRELARAHGGRIDVVSRSGAGATFTLHLPIDGRRPAPPGLRSVDSPSLVPASAAPGAAAEAGRPPSDEGGP